MQFYNIGTILLIYFCLLGKPAFRFIFSPNCHKRAFEPFPIGKFNSWSYDLSITFVRMYAWTPLYLAAGPRFRGSFQLQLPEQKKMLNPGKNIKPCLEGFCVNEGMIFQNRPKIMNPFVSIHLLCSNHKDI